MATFLQMEPKYSSWLKRAQLKPAWVGAIERAARKCLASRTRYKQVETKTGVPWAWIAAAHMRESNNNFAGVLHNGEHIIGTGRRTSLVPAGRGPFSSWENAALDALAIKGFSGRTDWTPEKMLYRWESFNGFGYANMGRPSPYVWQGTNIYTSGKYVRDGVYDGGHVDQQLGCYAVWQRIQDIELEEGLREGPKINLIEKVRTFIKYLITTVTGLAWADYMGYIREVWGVLSGVFTPGTVIALIAVLGGGWLVLNALDKMIVEEAKAPSAEPEVQAGEHTGWPAHQQGEPNASGVDEQPADVAGPGGTGA